MKLKKRKRSSAAGRPRQNHDMMPARFAAGTFDKIDARRSEGETRADFLRTAVDNEMRRRDRAGYRARTVVEHETPERSNGASLSAPL